MRNVFRMLGSLYSSWRFIFEVDPEAPVTHLPRSGAGRSESPEEELHRMREARAQTQEKVKHFRTLALGTLARSYEESLRAIERRIQALEMNQRPAA